MINKAFSVVMLIGLAIAFPSTAAETAENIYYPVVSESVAQVYEINPIASDGHASLSLIRKPPGEGPFPAVMLIHGGAPGWDRQTLHEFSLHIHASRFLAAGYVVVSVTRRDLDLSLPVDVEQAPVRDVIAVYDWLAKQSYVDADSIAIRGTSIGGYLTLELAAARKAAAVVVEEPFSFPFVGIARSDSEQTADTGKIEAISSPMLLIRGDQTANINDFNRDVFIPAAQSVGKSLQIETWPGALHSFAFYDNAKHTPDPAISLEAFTIMEAFISNRLQTQPQALPEILVNWQAVDY